MSKGWESKSVEEQQAAAADAPDTRAEAAKTDGNRRRSDADVKRQRQALELQRERILSERTSSPHRRSALEAALTAIELELEKLGNMVHL